MTIDELEKELELAGWYATPDRLSYSKSVDRGFFNVNFKICINAGDVGCEVRLARGMSVILAMEWFGPLEKLQPGFVLEMTQSLAKTALDNLGPASQLLAETAMTGSIPS